MPGQLPVAQILPLVGPVLQWQRVGLTILYGQFLLYLWSVLGIWMGDNCKKTCNKCKCNCCSYKININIACIRCFFTRISIPGKEARTWRHHHVAATVWSTSVWGRLGSRCLPTPGWSNAIQRVSSWGTHLGFQTAFPWSSVLCLGYGWWKGGHDHQGWGNGRGG